MKKLLLQGGITIAVFFAFLLLFQQFDWVKIFKVQEATDKTEEKLGDLFWDFFSRSETEIEDHEAWEIMDSLVTKICLANNIDPATLDVHMLLKSDINAFALPDGHLVIYSGLILHAQNPEELSGVISHEIAHIQEKHVMKKLLKEIGLSVLISMTTGSGGGEIVKETAKMLSSTAFDRNLEKEADIKAVDYLVAAHINPEPFADFLYGLADKTPDALKYLSWMSTHPESKERAAYILEYASGKTKSPFEPAMSAASWEALRLAVAN